MKNTIHVIVVLAATSALLVCSGFARSPNASPAAPASKQPFQMPDMGKMYTQMMNAMNTEILRPEHATALAHFQRLYYDALIKEGFTKEEALYLLRANQLPMSGVK